MSYRYMTVCGTVAVGASREWAGLGTHEDATSTYVNLDCTRLAVFCNASVRRTTGTTCTVIQNIGTSRGSGFDRTPRRQTRLACLLLDAEQTQFRLLEFGRVQDDKYTFTHTSHDSNSMSSHIRVPPVGRHAGSPMRSPVSCGLPVWCHFPQLQVRQM